MGIWDKTQEELSSEIAKGQKTSIETQTLALLEMLKLIGEETQKNHSVSVENTIRQVVGEVSVTRPDWIKELLPDTIPIQKKLDYIASAIIRKEVVRKMDFNRPSWLDEIKPKDIVFPEAKDTAQPIVEALQEVLQAIREKEITEKVEVTNALEIKEPKWWKLPDFETPIGKVIDVLKSLPKVFKIEGKVTVDNPVTEVTVKNPQKDVKITNLKGVEDKLDLVTAQLIGLGNTGGSSGGSQVDTSSLATEETLQAVLSASGGSIYNYIQSDTDATYKYYGYTDGTNWKIKRKTLSSGVWKVATDAGDYDTAFAARSSQTYNYV